jgi:hypothetical protein
MDHAGQMLPTRRSLLTVIGFAGLGLAATGLTACTDLTEAAPRGPRIMAPGIPVAVESISGAPEALQAQFNNALASEASARQVELVDGKEAGKDKARFRIRGYLDAYATDDGKTALAYVWDVFDVQKRRAQRVQGASLRNAAAGDDPWAQMDQVTVARAASDSMNAIAGFLAASGNTA